MNVFPAGNTCIFHFQCPNPQSQFYVLTCFTFVSTYPKLLIQPITGSLITFLYLLFLLIYRLIIPSSKSWLFLALQMSSSVLNLQAYLLQLWIWTLLFLIVSCLLFMLFEMLHLLSLQIMFLPQQCLFRNSSYLNCFSSESVLTSTVPLTSTVYLLFNHPLIFCWFINSTPDNWGSSITSLLIQPITGSLITFFYCCS